MTDSYANIYAASLGDPEQFWLSAASAISWSHVPRKALDDSHPPFYRWFPDAELNTCYNALDRHIEAGHGDRLALVYDSPVAGQAARYSYSSLREEVSLFAGVLRDLGVGKGDRVVIYMPMIPQAIIAMLACARLGAIHSVVFGGFAAKELAARIADMTPKVLVCASCGIEPKGAIDYKTVVDQAIAEATNPPSSVVVLQRSFMRAKLNARDEDWDLLMARARPASYTVVAATDPLYVLYTSGTSGKPKGVVRDNGGHAVALSWAMDKIFDIGPGDVWWAASDVGWVVGHSFLVYGPLLVGATTVLYEGKPVGTPDAGAFWRVISEHQVRALWTAPTTIRAIKKADSRALEAARYDLSSFETLYLGGERLDPETYHWARSALGVTVIDNWWQTETGWPIAANPRGIPSKLPIKPGSPSAPMPGYNVAILDPSGEVLKAGVEGAICVKLPLPPGTLSTLWEGDRQYVDSYLSMFPGYYATGDSGYFDQDGYLYVLGRMDDVINVAGHRFSTGTIEAVLAEHPAVAECAVVGVRDPLKGQVPRGLVVLKMGVGVDPQQLCSDLVAAVRREVGAVAALSEVFVVDALPKTRSGKILRKSMRAIADGRVEPVPPTIEDATVLEDIRRVLAQLPRP